MKQHASISASDRLRDPQAALLPDARSNPTWTLADQHQLVSGFELLDSVPIDVRVHFETAKNLYLYAWLAYRFYPMSEKQALATLEFALRERLVPLFPAQFGSDAERQPGLSALLRKARDEKLISNHGLRASHRWAMQKARSRVSDEACVN